MSDHVSIRMYNVGFGDCLLIRVCRDGVTWRMLVDCGVHNQGARQKGEVSQGIDEVVDLVVTDLAEEADGAPHLDVVAATHRHADHVKGFAADRWRDVKVDEVWLPFVEDMTDPQGDALRRGVEFSSFALLQSVQLAASSGGSPELAVARQLLENARPNQKAMDRLLRLDGQGFATPHRVRYWPSREATDNTVALHGRDGELSDAVIHLFGPPRESEFLRRMAPPRSAEWLRMAGASPVAGAVRALFDPAYRIDDAADVSEELRALSREAALGSLNVLDPTLLAAAVRLDRVVNNTSLFMVLEVGDVVVVLPGDAQQGAWEHVRALPTARALLQRCTVYKIGHHGSHNATPRAFLEEDWHPGSGYALLPWGEVKRWPEIPKDTLIEKLEQDHHTVLRFDAKAEGPEVTFGGEDDWVEVRFEV